MDYLMVKKYWEAIQAYPLVRVVDCEYSSDGCEKNKHLVLRLEYGQTSLATITDFLHITDVSGVIHYNTVTASGCALAACFSLSQINAHSCTRCVTFFILRMVSRKTGCYSVKFYKLPVTLVTAVYRVFILVYIYIYTYISCKRALLLSGWLLA